MNDLALALIADYGGTDPVLRDLPVLPRAAAVVLAGAGVLAALLGSGFVADGGDDRNLFSGAVGTTAAIGYSARRWERGSATGWLLDPNGRAMHLGAGLYEPLGQVSVFFSCWLGGTGAGVYQLCQRTLAVFVAAFCVMGHCRGNRLAATYVGSGYSFADRVAELTSLMGNVSS
jgi:hypothetical protein